MSRPCPRSIRTLAALALAAALSSCGPRDTVQDAAPAVAAEPVRACALLTLDDVRALVGPEQPIAAMSPLLQSQDPGKCNYGIGYGTPPPLLSVEARRQPSAEQAARLHESSRSMLERMARGDLREVPGLGDGAYWAGGNVQQLHVVAGDVRLIVTDQVGAEAMRLDTARRIAEQALARL